MSKPINVAIIGAGIGAQHLAAYLQLPDQFCVKTLCDIDEQRARDVRGDQTDVRIESDFDAVLADDEIDLVDICLPPHLHFDMSMSALAAHKHVVCEKPLVSSLRDADILAVQAKKFDRVLTPVFQYRYGPALSTLKALIAAGMTGKPYTASVETHWHRDTEYYSNPWRGTWKGEQGGAVLGHAIHNHDLLCTVFGPIRRLHAFTTTRVNDIEVEDCAAVSFEMENGALASSSITLGASDDTTRLRFCFENLTAESGMLPYAPADGEWTFSARGQNSQQELDAFIENLPPSLSGFTGFFAALADRLNGIGTDSVTIEDGRRSLELVTAIYDSARSGAEVKLPLKEGHALYECWISAH